MEREKLDERCEQGILGLVLAILVFSPLAFGSVRQESFDPFIVVQWTTLAILVIWGVRFTINPKHRLLWPPVCWGVLAFVVYAIGRYLTADIEYVARQELLKILVYTALFFAVVNNLHRQETTHLVGLTLIFVGMLIALYAIFQFLTESESVWHLAKPEAYRKRGSGTFVCPNNTAGYLEMILPLGLLYTLTGRFGHMTKIFLGYASLAIFTGIAATISRGGWLATGVTLVVMFIWLMQQRDFRLQGLILLGALLLISVGFYFKSDLSRNRFERLTWAGNAEDYRFRIWPVATKVWQENIWFGAGPAHFDHRFRQHRPADDQLQGRPDRVHNDYLNTLVDYGLVGALLVAGVWGVFYWQVFRSWRFVQRSQNDLAAKRSNKSTFVAGGALGLLAILLHSLVDFNMHIPANAILAVTLMALVTGHFRFSTEAYWHTVRLPLRIPVLTCLALLFGYLALQTWQRTRENYWLHQAAQLKRQPAEHIRALKAAFQAAPTNGELAYEIGEALRLQSWSGREGYKAYAEEALTWFEKSSALNRYDPFPLIGQGMCLDWLGRHQQSGRPFEQAYALDPNGYVTLAHVGWHHVQVQDYLTAKKWFERSLTVKAHQNPVAWHYLTIANQKLNEGGVNN